MSESEEPTPDQEDDVRTTHAEGPVALPGAADDGFDPFARLFTSDGSIDQAHLEKRIPELVSLLRNQPACFGLRLDHDALASRLLADDADGLRGAQDEKEFEAVLGDFSREHLHELCNEEMAEGARSLLAQLAGAELPHKERVAAAIGVTLLSGPPDEHGLVGRTVHDFIFRITLEEVHAKERIRKLARETEGGLSSEELSDFWNTYPALRHRFEERYRREVTHVLQQIEADSFPLGFSIDLALRGTAALHEEVARVRGSSGEGKPRQAQEILREPFASDMLDGGKELVLERWRTGSSEVKGSAKERRAYARTVETAIRLVGDNGPGADAILFYSYLQSVAEGRFFVEDAQEAEVAREVFAQDGLSTDGVIAYADHQRRAGRGATARRLLLAALELWPENEAVRAGAEALGDSDMDKARTEPQGPIYDDDESEG